MSDGVWVSVSEAASMRGVSKQALSKRLKRLGGQVSTRQDGRQLLVNLPEFDRVTGAQTDPSQVLRNRGGAAARPDEHAGEVPKARPVGDLAQQAFSVQRAKREGYDAEMARLKLEEQLGRVVAVVDVQAAMVRCAEILVRKLDQIPALTDDPKLKAHLKDKVRELRQVLADEMRLLATGDQEGRNNEQAA